jgi:hypothetical protein
MKSILKSMIAAAVLATAGTAANAALYDWNYTGAFEYQPAGNYGGPFASITGTLTGVLDGTASGNGVFINSFQSLVFNDGQKNMDLVVADHYFTSFLSNDGQSSHVWMDGNRAILYLDPGVFAVIYRENGQSVNSQWVSTQVNNSWSLTERQNTLAVTTPVPEPTTALLAILGAPIVALRVRRRGPTKKV